MKKSLSTRRRNAFLWEPRPRGDGRWSARLFATRASLLQKKLDANIVGPDQKKGAASPARKEPVFAQAQCSFVGAPPPGRWWVVCEAFCDEGVAPTKKAGCKHRWAGSKKGAATPARKGPVIAQAQCSFVGAPPPGRWAVVCEAFRDGGVAPTKKAGCKHRWAGSKNGRQRLQGKGLSLRRRNAVL